ncbi:IclR family transcriptional regulator [Breznakiella homolactica]|uniref:IclR family transcriptional regulator n=1 Tax=Breznakiella homolactica TaxID=2798577 RepID=A0A7T8BBU1_9SPIR|nr:IclR family transcriptional regulator [Breznakiella homolactica]QQO10937.1 IclR family transcriptional regulator [Breznakiella homolactica]
MANVYGVSVQSVDRALEILEIIAGPGGDELGITDIAAKIGLNKSTVYGLVNTLVNREYLEQNPDTKRYRLGIKLFEMGSLVQRRIDVRAEAKPYCQELSEKYDSTVHLAAFYDFEIVYIDKVDSPDAVVQYSQLGRRAPMYCTGVGKAILANIPESERELFYRNVELRSFTANTITTREDLEKELARIRERGYAVDDEEIQPGLRCVAAPIFDHLGRPSAAISVSKPLNRMNSQMQESIARDITGVAGQISRRIGYQAA